MEAGRHAQYDGRGLDEAALRWWELEGQQQKGEGLKAALRSLIPYMRGRPLREAPAAAQDARRDWQEQGLAPATVHRRLSILRRICNAAYREWGWIDNPIADRISLPKLKPSRTLYLTPEQVEALAAACPRATSADIIRLAAWTGLRRGEVLRLCQGGYSVRDNCIILDEQTKSGKPRTIPVPPKIMPILDRRPFIVSRTALYRDWNAARLACGLPRVPFHTLRHTYASWLMQSGVPAKAIQELMGHSSLAMVERYSHLAPAHLVAAVATMVDRMDAPNVVNLPAPGTSSGTKRSQGA